MWKTTAHLRHQCKSHWGPLAGLLTGLMFVLVQLTTAHVGDKLTWINNDPFLHNATAKGQWDIDIQPGKTATLTLKKPGAFEYICRYHPNMVGHVTVTDR